MSIDSLYKQYPIILIIVCVGVAAFLYRMGENKKYQNKAEVLEQTLNNLNEEMKVSRIKWNDSISLCQAEIKSLTITKKNLQQKYDKLLKASNSKAKDVNSVTEVITEIHKVDTVVALVDSFGGLNARLEDPFIKIDVNVFPDKKTIIDYNIRDSITVISFQKKHRWLFGLIKWNESKGVKVITHNPKSEIVSIEAIEIID